MFLELYRHRTKFRDVSHPGQELQALSVALGEAEAATVVRFYSAQRCMGSRGLTLPHLLWQGTKKQSVTPEHSV